MILGISASGRVNGETAKMVKGVMQSAGLESTFISLANKTIKGCTGCLQCAGTGVCVVRDDWNDLVAQIREADALVFGAPSYSGNINAMGHAFLERMYATRHGRFLLAGKLAVIVTPSTPDNPAEKYIKQMFTHNKLVVLTTVNKQNGLAPCYTCGYGHDCWAGYVVKTNNNQPVDEITDDMFPPRVDDCEATQREMQSAGWLLARVLGANQHRGSV